MKGVTLTTWGPSEGDTFSDVTITQLVSETRACHRAGFTVQVTRDTWPKGAYVTTWDGGGASCKHFPGADGYGWGGTPAPGAEALCYLLAKASMS